MDESFTLHNLEVSVTGEPKTFVCSHKLGSAFRVVGENLIFDTNNTFSMYALATLMPYLPAKQRETHKNDWMTTDAYIACPDPNCGAKFKISRTDQSTFNHSDVTKVRLKP
jgi:uncharacterized repeat protein (TIGR04076 family)